MFNNRIEIKGGYGRSIVFTSNPNIDEESYKGMLNFLNSKPALGSKIRFMPDYHAGKGCVIGTTATIYDSIIPNVVGVDIGCGVLAYEVDKEIDLKKLDEIIHTHIPSGNDIAKSRFHKRVKDWPLNISMRDFTDKMHEICLKIQNKEYFSYASRSLGTLGGGNHMIEVNVTKSGTYMIVVHSGSRNFGLRIAKYWQNIADSPTKDDLRKEIEEIRNKYSGVEIRTRITQLLKDNKPKGYLEGEQMKGYLEDADFAAKYAVLNREIIIQTIMHKLSVEPIRRIESVHNYIDVENKILRKGAIAAYKDQEILIPLNMRDGIIIAVGKGNPDWNYSAPHGAGRIMSRSKAKEKISMEEFEKSMDGIYTTCIKKSTLDEAPQAYKDPSEILSVIEDTCDIKEVARPVYNFKGA